MLFLKVGWEEIKREGEIRGAEFGSNIHLKFKYFTSVSLTP